jgi:hypothetical protein
MQSQGKGGILGRREGFTRVAQALSGATNGDTAYKSVHVLMNQQIDTKTLINCRKKKEAKHLTRIF